MNSAFVIISIALLFGCSPKSKESAAPSDSSETAQGSDETATVNGTVEQEDTGSFVDEINVDDWSTFEAQNTAGTNLLLTQESTIPESEKVAIYKLGKDASGTHDFFPETSVELSSDNTFNFTVQAYTYYVVKYKTLTGFVPALAKDTTLPLVLNAESSIAVNLFIRMVQTEDGKALADAKNIDVKIIESIAKKISSPGITDFKTVIDAVLGPVLSQQKDSDNNLSKSDAEIDAIVQKIIDVATTGDALTAETKSILKKPTAYSPKNAAVSLGFTDQDLRGGIISGLLQITAPAVEDFLQYVVYWGASSTAKLNDSPVLYIPVIGKNLTATIPEGTQVPEGVTHLLVFTKNLNGEMATGVSVAITDLGVPVNAPVSMSFTDIDPDGLQVEGTINLTKAANETDITHYVFYWGSNTTTKQSSIPIATLAKNGSIITLSISANTLIPTSPSATHILAFSRNADGEMASGRSVAIVDIGVPTVPAAGVAFTDTDSNGGQIAGTVTITKAADENDFSHYVLYWGSNSVTKRSDTEITSLAVTGSNVTYNFAADTIIPTAPGATHLLVFTKNEDGEMATGVNIAIIDLGVPVNPALNLSFTDSDLDGGQIGGSVTITKAGIETDLTHYVLYWGSNATTKQNLTAIANIAKTGANVSYNFGANTVIPAAPTATHLLVYTKNNDGEMATGINIAIADLGVPVNAAAGVAFTDSDTTSGQISGTLTITKAGVETDLTHYVLYWGSNSTTKQSGTSISQIAKTGSNVTHNFAADTSIPSSPTATHLLVFTKNADGEMATEVTVAITDNTGSSCSGGGVSVGGHCWYSSASGASCTTACSAASLAYNTATLTYAGSSGSLAQCKAVIDAVFGGNNTVSENASSVCFYPLGCGYDGSDYRRCAAFSTTEGEMQIGFTRVCACQ